MIDILDSNEFWELSIDLIDLAEHTKSIEQGQDLHTYKKIVDLDKELKRLLKKQQQKVFKSTLWINPILKTFVNGWHSIISTLNNILKEYPIIYKHPVVGELERYIILRVNFMKLVVDKMAMIINRKTEDMVVLRDLEQRPDQRGGKTRRNKNKRKTRRVAKKRHIKSTIKGRNRARPYSLRHRKK